MNTNTEPNFDLVELLFKGSRNANDLESVFNVPFKNCNFKLTNEFIFIEEVEIKDEKKITTTKIFSLKEISGYRTHKKINKTN